MTKALRLRPDDAATLVALGRVRERDGRLDEALALYARAAAFDPTDARIPLHLGNALVALGRHAEAEAAFEEALRLAPGDATAHNGLGVALDHLGRYDEAESAFRSALAADSKFGEAACNLSSVLLCIGDIDGATAWFERAIALEPRNGWFHFCLVQSRSGSIDCDRLAAMERLAGEIGTLPEAQQAGLQFALASAYEHIGRYDDAFRRLLVGNELKRRAIHYDEATTLHFSASLVRTFTEPFVAALRGWGNPSVRPIFVFGMPRSGTTLVEQVLAAQGAVIAGGELPVFALLARDLSRTLAGGSAHAELGGQIRILGDRYISATDALAKNGTHVTDKMPENFWYAPLIHLALPNARMVHVRRDPLDTCVSCFASLSRDDAVPYAYDLAELGHYYRAYDRTMTSWRTFLPTDRLLEIEYERFVDDFETEARRLVAFCGLPWDARTLRFHEVRRPVRTASATQVRRPLYRSAIGRSRRFTRHLEPLLDALTD